MTFIQRIESLSSRFFSERTYELIVEPALADLQHDAGADDGRYSMGGRLSVGASPRADRIGSSSVPGRVQCLVESCAGSRAHRGPQPPASATEFVIGA